MEPADYKLWLHYQKAVENRKKGGFQMKSKTEEEEALEEQLYDAVSKRAWTDICLQLLKVRLNCMVYTSITLSITCTTVR